MNENAVLGPEITVSRWFNTNAALSLAELRGKVVVLHAFQMLCPGCVQHGIPQAKRLHEQFDSEQVSVIGLHTVFEHHAVMTAAALDVFIREYRIEFPVGVDQPAENNRIPLTMAAYGMRGTPTLVVLDSDRYVRLHEFGAVPDLFLGTVIGSLLQRQRQRPKTKSTVD